ncbi:chaperonin GroEL [Candidatus Woesebacteria bacterium]|nr:MAG: chaperonin GroEL [Candidatus Woesebacteria bacterium]
MAKQLQFSDEARQSLMKGINLVAKAVVTTLGPKGRNIAIDKKWGSPSIIHDGVTVAKEIELQDPFENMGAQLVKAAAEKTNDIAGDGTTTATLLAQQMTQAGMKNITAGANPMMVKKGMEKAVALVLEELEKMAKPLKGKEEIAQVATISAGDELIGAKIAEALEKVGRDGVVTVEEGKGFTIDIEYKEGMEFDRGYASLYFVTNSEKMEAEVEDAYILLTDKKISSVQEMLPFLEKFVKVSKNLVIIADDVDGEALATLVVNKLKGMFNVLVVKAPGFGDRRKAMLEDIAILTGGKVISEDTGASFENIELSDLGRADKVWSDKDKTQIVGGKGQASDLKARVNMLKSQIEASDSDFDREKLEERLAKLAGGVAVINVGAATEVELNDKKERVKDAVGATKAAIEAGIVPGGGVALLKARKALKKLKDDSKASGDEATGINIVFDALDSPVRYLAINSGEGGEGYHIIKAIEESSIIDYGYNALDGSMGSVMKKGILDPVKVTRSALINAASVAMMVLTTEGLITDIPEKEPQSPAGGMPGGGMMGM